MNDTYASRKLQERYDKKSFWIIVIILIFSTLLLNVNFINFLRLPMFIIICFLGYRSAYSTFTVLVASIIIPDIGFGPFTATQLAILLWILYWLLTQKNHKIYFSKRGAILIFLMIIWFFITAVINSDASVLLEFIKVIGVALVAFHVMSLKNVRLELCLLSLTVALGLAALPYYMINIFHVPGFVNQRIRGTSIVDYVSTRSGETRYSIVKQDPNAVSVLLSTSLWCSINLSLHFRSLGLPKRFRWLSVFGLYVFFPLIAAESRTGFLSLVVGFVLTVLFKIWDKSNIEVPVKFDSANYKQGRISDVFRFFVFVVIGLILVSTINKIGNLMIFERINLIILNLQMQGLGDRGELALIAWNTILDQAPIFGIGTNRFLENFSGGYAVHNTFLDIGVASGIPGMIIMIIVLLFPLVGCLKRRQRIKGEMWIGLVGYLTVMLFMLSLSIIGDKLFWIFWSMLIVIYDKSFVFQRNKLYTPAFVKST